MKRYLSLFKNTWTEFTEDKAQRLAASLAYYTIFSITPLLLIAIAIAGLAFGKSQAQAQIVEQLRNLIGGAGAHAIEEMLTNAAKPKQGTVAIIVGFATLLFGAAGVFGQLKDALNTIWNLEPKKEGGIMAMIKARFLSFAMVLGVGFLLLVSLVIDTAVSAMGRFAADHLPGGQALWQVLQLAISFVVITFLFAMIFRFLPDIRIEWRDVWFGAGFTALLFVIGKFGLGLWLGKKSVGSAYGAAGSLVVLLLWIYWSTSILFFGAEFTQVYARTHGSMRASANPKHAAPAVQPQEMRPVVIQAGGGGLIKLAAGMIVGTLLGGIAATFVFFKSLKKLFT